MDYSAVRPIWPQKHTVPAAKTLIRVLIRFGWILFQVDEAVAVLQAHQAKEAAQKSVTNSAVVPSVWIQGKAGFFFWEDATVIQRLELVFVKSKDYVSYLQSWGSQLRRTRGNNP